VTATGDPRPRPLVDAVVWDLGGVLIDWDPRHLYRQVFADEAEMEWFLAEVCHPEWNETQDAGRPFAAGIAEAVGRHPAYRDQIEAFFARWPEMVAGEVEGSAALLDALVARGVPAYALTNWSAETFPLARPRFPFLETFAGIVVSGEEGTRKPHAGIFRILCERFDLDPASTLFVDDSERNVAAARDLGFVAHRFTTAAALADELVRLGLLDAVAAG
jgi:2-haloacid dehalogenase